MNQLKQITTNKLRNLIGTPNLQIIDLREVEAYNGWQLKGEKRGGHIKGARSLPAKWAQYMDWVEIIGAKQINKDQTIVLYAYEKSTSELVAKLFLKLGYNDILIYPDFLSEWTEIDELPMEKLARYKHLVNAGWVNDQITNPDSENTVIVHAHYRNREAYLSGHIPTAIDMDTLALESPETWNRRSPAELRKAFEKHGITANTTVIIYGKFMHPDNDDEFPGSAAGHLGAIRCVAIMLYAGISDIRILNGGFQSWLDAGYEIHFNDVEKKKVTNFNGEIPANPKLFVDIEEAKMILKSDVADLISVRSWSEYIGEVSGYNYIKKKGRIPGSIFGNCGTDAYHMENYRNVDHTVREAKEVEKIWAEAGIGKNKHLAFYCGTGWRGSEAFLNAWLMGYENVSVFDGGWFEWSNDETNPYETDIPTSNTIEYES